MIRAVRRRWGAAGHDGSMTAPTLPLLVFEGRDLSTFDTIERACGYLEAIDVRNGEFDSFDSEPFSL